MFPFLYEELSHAPHALVGDLCRFLKTEVPANLSEVLRVRENASPRSQAGQLLSRPFFQVSYALEKFTPIKARRLRELGARLGTRLDENFAPLQIDLDQDMARELRKDWENSSAADERYPRTRFVGVLGTPAGRSGAGLDRTACPL